MLLPEVQAGPDGLPAESGPVRAGRRPPPVLHSVIERQPQAGRRPGFRRYAWRALAAKCVVMTCTAAQGRSRSSGRVGDAGGGFLAAGEPMGAWQEAGTVTTCWTARSPAAAEAWPAPAPCGEAVVPQKNPHRAIAFCSRCRQWLAVSGALPRVVGEEEGRQSLGEGDRCLFGHVVSGVDGVPSQVVSPVRPDGQRVSMEFFEVVVF